jgi:hypothetical protein
MTVCNNGTGCSNTLNAPVTTSTGCVDQFGCPSGVCPDFVIRRHDTKPEFKVSVEDCDGPLDLENLVLEANMWAKAKLKTSISETDDYFGLADNIGFNQVMVNDIIVMERTRLPEHMLVIGFDENQKLIRVQRGYNGTTPSSWKKGTPMRIFRILNAPASIEVVKDDLVQPDGSTLEDELIESVLIYEWEANDTCLPGCYWMEFKLLKEIDEGAPEPVNLISAQQAPASTIPPSFTDPSLTPEDFGCKLGTGIEWCRRFPVSGEGFLIRIEDSPTAEL